MKNKQMEAAARLMYEACRQQHSSEESCQGCEFHENDGLVDIYLSCFAGFPRLWVADFPELKEEGR